MDVSNFIFSRHVNLIFFFPPFLEREEPEWCCLECQGRVCHKDIIALENGHLLPFKSHVCEWEMSVRVKPKNTWVFDSILVLLKSVLIFHHGGFYGTDSIHEKSDGRNLIFQVQMFVMCEEKDGALWGEELTLWTSVRLAFLTVTRGGRWRRGRWGRTVWTGCPVVCGLRNRLHFTDRCRSRGRRWNIFETETFGVGVMRGAVIGHLCGSVGSKPNQVLLNGFLRKWLCSNLIERCKIHSKEALP